MENSVEERMLTFQDSKATLGKGTFAKLKKKELAKAKLTAMKDLFEVDEGAVHTWDALQHGLLIDSDDELDDF